MCGVADRIRVVLGRDISRFAIFSAYTQSQRDLGAISKQSMGARPPSYTSLDKGTIQAIDKGISALNDGFDNIHVHFDTVVKLWDAIRTATGWAERSLFFIRKTRQKIMLAVRTLYQWLQDLMQTIINSETARTDPGSPNENDIALPDWVSGLVETIHGHLLAFQGSSQGRKASAIIDGQVFFPNATILEGQRRFTLRPKVSPRKYLDAKELSCYVAEQTCSAISHWLRFPIGHDDLSALGSYRNFQSQGQFVALVLKYFETPDILLFDGVWESFCNVHQRVFGLRGTGKNSVPADCDWLSLEVTIKDLKDEIFNSKDV